MTPGRACLRFDVRDTGNSAPAAVRHLYACARSTEAPAGKLPHAAYARVVEEKWTLLTRLMRTVMFNQVRTRRIESLDELHCA